MLINCVAYQDRGKLIDRPIAAISDYVVRLSVRNQSRKDFLGLRGRCEHEPNLLRQGAGFCSDASSAPVGSIA